MRLFAWIALLSAISIPAADRFIKPQPITWVSNSLGWITSVNGSVTIAPYVVSNHIFASLTLDKIRHSVSGNFDNTLRGLEVSLDGSGSALKSEALHGINHLHPRHPGATNAAYDHGGKIGVAGTVAWFNNDTFQAVPHTYGAGVMGRTYGSYGVNIGGVFVAAPMHTNQHVVGVAGIGLGDFEENGSTYTGGYFEATSRNNNPTEIKWVNAGVLIDNRDRPQTPLLVTRTTPTGPLQAEDKLVINGDGSITIPSNTGRTRWRIQVDDAGILKVTRD